MPTARDGYDAYFTEKLWAWVPAIHRERDADDGGGALRALLTAIASQAAKVKRSQDRLGDDGFVELADDWAVPYIAELVATRLVSALNPRARRADVAKTIYYRRRKGTLLVLEQLIADMSGWDGKVVEEFRRLGRMRHGLDGPARPGRLTGTPEGGLADLRRVRGARLAGDPFDEFHYTPETRRPLGQLGVHGIATLGVHLFRLASVELNGVQPRRLPHAASSFQHFTFDPSGRDVPLFAGNDPSRDWSTWRSADEWALPREIDCRLLNEAVYEIGDEETAWILNGAPIASLPARLAAAADLRKLVGQRFVGREPLLGVLAGLPQAVTLSAGGVQAGLLLRALVDTCGSAALLPDDTGQAAFGPPAMQVGVLAALPASRTATRAGDLSTWALPVAPPPAGVLLYIDPARGRFTNNIGGNPAPRDMRVRYRVGMALPIGAGAPGREIDTTPSTVTWATGSLAAGTPAIGVLEVADSATYRNPPDQAAITDLTVRAAEGQRPYIRLLNHWRLGASGNDRQLALDGLWLGGRPYGDLVLAGSFALVTIRHCTLDPGGADAKGHLLSPCELVVRGVIEHLVIERSILASIRLQGANASIERLTLIDCLIDASQPGMLGIATPRADVSMTRCTVIGRTLDTLALDVERLDATDTLIAARADVTDLQSGCFRFSARGPLSRVPHPYESHEIDDLERLFRSRRFGDPHHGALAERAPAVLLTGSEQGSEIGATCASMNPIKFASLRTKVDEYLPFGRLPAYLEDN